MYIEYQALQKEAVTPIPITINFCKPVMLYLDLGTDGRSAKDSFIDESKQRLCKSHYKSNPVGI